MGRKFTSIAMAAVVLAMLLGAAPRLTSAAETSSAGVAVVVVVSPSIQLSLPAFAPDGSTPRPMVRSNTPLNLSVDAGSPTVAAATSAAATGVFYTVVAR